MLTDEELSRLIARSCSYDVPEISRAEITRRATAYRRHRRTAHRCLAATAAAVIAAGVFAAMNVNAKRDPDNHAAPTSSVSPSGPLDLQTQEKRCFEQLTHPFEPSTIPRDPVAGRPIKPTPTSTAAHYTGPYAPLFVLAHGGGPRWLFYFDDKDRFSRTYFCDDAGQVEGDLGADKRYNGILAGTPYPPAAPVPPSEITKAQPYPGFVTGFVPADARTVSVTIRNGAGPYPGQVSQGVFAVWVTDVRGSDMTLIATSERHIYTIRGGHMTTADR